MKNIHNQYQQQNIMNLTKGEQLILLYDEAIKELNLAKFYISKVDYSKCNENFHKANKINNYLISILNRKYDIADNLLQLYMFCSKQIATANATKNLDMIDEIISIYSDLRESFSIAMKTKT